MAAALTYVAQYLVMTEDYLFPGNVNFFSIARILDNVLTLNLNHTADEHRDSNRVMLAQRYEVSKSIHERAALVYPLNLEGKCLARSRSSFIYQTILSEESSGNLAVTSMQKVVCVNASSGKSVPLPNNYFKDVSVPFVSDLGSIFPPIIAGKPHVDSHSSTREVQPSDTDYLVHTNQASYIKFALDGIAKAAREGVLSGIKDDVCFYRGHTAATLHLGESFVGDLLTVKVWENQENPLQIHCVIRKKEYDIFYSDLSFYPREVYSNL